MSDEPEIGFVYPEVFQDETEFATAIIFDTRHGKSWPPTDGNFRIKRRMLARARVRGFRYQLVTEDDDSIYRAAAVLRETQTKLAPFTFLTIEGISPVLLGSRKIGSRASAVQKAIPLKHYLLFSNNEDRIHFRLLMTA